MARNWIKMTEWNNEGSEPSSNLKQNGFSGGYKPPASVFNHFFNRSKKCTDELQKAVDEVDAKTQPIAQGGTGAKSAADARTNLNVPSIDEVEYASSFKIGESAYNYVDWVLPLIPLNLNESATVYFTGSVFLKRQNTLNSRMTRVFVSCGKTHGAAIPTYSMNLDNIDTSELKVEPRTFTYNGVKYFGLYVITKQSGYDGTKLIIGKASHRDIIQPITVYNNQTKEVLNEEIYNSLADEGNINEKIFYGTPIVRMNGSSYDVYHKGNKPTAAETGALPISGGTITGENLKLYNGQGRVATFPTSTFIEHSNTAGDTQNNRQLLVTSPSAQSNMNNAVLMKHTVDGTSMTYRMYGEHYKPTAADIGAATTTLSNVTDVDTARQNLKNAGKSVTGKTFKYTDRQDTTEVTAGEGAEIFNDYRDRSYSNVLDEETYSGNAATGNYSTAMGSGNAAGGKCSFAIGIDNFAKGECSFVGGTDNRANDYQTVIGKYAAGDTGASTSSNEEGSLFVIGNGLRTVTTGSYGSVTAKTTRMNAFRVSAKGGVYGNGAYNTSGADYAEYCEWLDGNPDNEDRRGLFVTLDGEKIKLASANDPIWGVISSNPSVVGDAQSECWKGMYLKDVFGDYITEKVIVPEYTDEITGEVVPEHEETRWVLNPDYDPDKEYISREFRAEWSAVGMVGKVVVVDDGTCQVNGYCTASDGGIATASKTGFRVLSRIDESHIKIFVTPNLDAFFE